MESYELVPELRGKKQSRPCERLKLKYQCGSAISRLKLYHSFREVSKVEETLSEFVDKLHEAEELADQILDHLCDDCEPVMGVDLLEHFGTPCTHEHQICELGIHRCRKSEAYRNINDAIETMHNLRRKIEKAVAA